MKRLRYLLSYLFVRPRRWFFHKMLCDSFGIRWWFEKDWYGTSYPNIHWWILYKTVWKFFRWLNNDAWRYFCTWEDGWLKHKPLISKIIHRIGQTTVGERTSGGECYHCGAIEGCQVELSQDETGKFFVLEKSWSVGTMDGTDYRFCGITICPKCGYKSYYEDGSL